jgi:quercetin dioxygenase-like cupin family protein
MSTRKARKSRSGSSKPGGVLDTIDNLVHYLDNDVVYLRGVNAVNVIRDAQARRIETPNGTMTTLASPSQGKSGQAVWRVEARPGMAGPVHAFDQESVWTWIDGRGAVQAGEERIEVAAGDTMVLPAGVVRQLFADEERGFTAIVAAPAGVQVYNPEGLEACHLVPSGTITMPLPWAE